MGMPRIAWASLTDAERLQLLDAAWESFVSAPGTLPLSPAQTREIDARQAAYESGAMPSRSWDVVRAEIRERLDRLA
jgi:putative addiction module component (TIGR02574 family)